MKILEINKFYFAKGGADKHFLDVVDLLESKGHDVAVFSMEHRKNLKTFREEHFLSAAGYTREYSLWQKIKGAGRMFYSPEAIKKMKNILDSFRPDVVHIHNIYHQLSPIILFEIKKRKIPVIMTVHDFKLINPNYNLYHNGKIYGRCKNKKYYQCFLDKCVKNSYLKSFLAMLEMYWHNTILKTYEKNVDLYVVPSEFVKNILAEWGIENKKITVLPHFANCGTRQNIAPVVEIKPRLGNKPYALYFGRIYREKGTEELADIFKNIQGMELYLAGEVEDDFDPGKYGNMRYLGYLSQSQLKNYIKNAEFIISGSRLPETFGLIALEAISYGRPFIGFRAGAFGEIIENGRNGYLAESREELEETIKKIINGEMRFNHSEIKTKYLEKYDSEKYYQNLLNIFQSQISLSGLHSTPNRN